MRYIAILLVAVGIGAAQTQSVKSFVGTVTGFRPQTAEVEIRPDEGEPVVAMLTGNTMAQKIAPGARDLKGAVTIQVTEIAAGDRVLVSLEPGTSAVLRIVVMPAGDIARRNEADRLDWQKRGLTGIVSSKAGGRITIKTRTLSGEAEATIAVDEHTRFKRYAPDSVKFSEAKPSKLSEVAIGDQLRARGEKSEDGAHLTADEVVFGTFLVKAGAIGTVNPETREITVKELGSNKTLTVVFTADSQIKEMPSFPTGPMPARGGMSGAAIPGRGGPAGGFDINQMLEHLPAVKLEDLKPGSTVVISSTKGARTDQLTAIMVLTNAETLIRMAAAMSGGSRAGQSGMGSQGMPPQGMGGAMMGGMTGGDSGGLGSLGLTGIMQ